MTTLQADTTRASAPVNPGKRRYRPLGLSEIQLTDGFWAARQAVNGGATLEHCDRWEQRMGWISNFADAAAGACPERRTGTVFSDSDVYKLIEAMAWEVGRTADPALNARVLELGGLVAAAQRPDGYLNTHFGAPGQPPRYSDLEWGHELYNYGHLFQAAVARLRTGHADAITEAALRAADHVCEVFGPGGAEAVCGHPEVESALVELYRTTGERRYLDQARLFVERRGRGLLRPIEFGPSYFQDDVPVREASVLRGHAVRALYLALGAIDVAVEDGDGELLGAVARQYRNALSKRTFLTGGMGSRHQDEAFGEDYELPPDRAYAETCAAVASVMVAWRLLLATGEEIWAEVIERTLFNAVAVAPSRDGRAFFYGNCLHQRAPGAPVDPDTPSARAASRSRAPWFEVACCPNNVARLYASLATYFATATNDGVQLHQYAPCRVDTRLGDGRALALEVRTGYPFGGDVEITVVAAPDDEWELGLRIPAWARCSALVDGRPAIGPLERLRGPMPPGTVVRLSLPIETRTVEPHRRIDAVRGCLAVERGPLVLCAESSDLPGGLTVNDVEVDPAGEVALTEAGAVIAGSAIRAAEPDTWPYAPPEPAPDAAKVRLDADPAAPGPEPLPITLIPYFDWGNRGPSTMRVWLPKRTAGPG
ncbi:MAG: glycoside hydrolase family 127 protein [Bifidobacteriaceae bacterium]|jgi:DUF1680 family protein|nr:glycoside hydrolase family 127 protein [Bifidobacteriaceae bacterium]